MAHNNYIPGCWYRWNVLVCGKGFMNYESELKIAIVYSRRTVGKASLRSVTPNVKGGQRSTGGVNSSCPEKPLPHL
jgi:hypothetical protein